MTWTLRWRKAGTTRWGVVHTVDKHAPMVTVCHKSVPVENADIQLWGNIPADAKRCKKCSGEIPLW